MKWALVQAREIIQTACHPYSSVCTACCTKSSRDRGDTGSPRSAASISDCEWEYMRPAVYAFRRGPARLCSSSSESESLLPLSEYESCRRRPRRSRPFLCVSPAWPTSPPMESSLSSSQSPERHVSGGAQC